MDILNLLGINGPEFEVMSLSQRAVEHIPYTPTFIRSLGLFEGEPISTLVAGFEYEKGTISLIPNTPRGKTNIQDRDYRTMRYLQVPHLPVDDFLYADELMQKRPMVGQTRSTMAMSELDKRQLKGFRAIDATIEYHMAGALRGIVLDKDGSTLYNLFNEFGVSAPAAIDIALSNTNTEVGSSCRTICNQIEDAVGGLAPTGYVALLGATMFDAFIGHAKVKDAYNYFAAQNGMNPNREDLRYKGFYFQGITWYQYRGMVSGQAFIPASEGRVFPLGVPGLFKTFYAPANYFETVGTDGLPRYAKLVPSADNSSINIKMQSNPLSICTIPEANRRLTMS